MTAIRGLVLGLFLVIELMACGVRLPAQEVILPSGSALFYGERRSPQKLNPYGNEEYNGPTDRFLTLIYESLYRFNHRRGEYDPILARSQPEEVVTPNGRPGLRVRLRSGIRWHDGRNLTSRDVRFSYEYAMATSLNAQEKRDLNSAISDIMQEDDLTVLFEFQPDTPDPQWLLQQWIIPAHRFTDEFVPAPGQPRLSEKPLGTGPFKFERRGVGSGNSYLYLTFFEDYHRGTPSLRAAEFQRRNEVNVLMEELLSSRSTDLSLVPEVPPERIPQVEEARNLLNYQESQGFSIYMVAFRLREGSILNDLTVREGLDYSIDREGLLQRALAGHGELLAGPMAPGGPMYHNQLEVTPYDTLRAKQRIYAANIPRGTPPLRFIFPREPGANDTRINSMVEELVSYFTRAGVAVQDQVLENRKFDEALDTGDFDLALLKWEFDPTFDLAPLFHSDNIGPGLTNFMAFSNDAVDDNLDRAAGEVDTIARREYMYRVQEIIARERPALFLFSAKWIYAYENNYVIPENDVDPFYFFDNVHRWARYRR